MIVETCDMVIEVEERESKLDVTRCYDDEKRHVKVPVGLYGKILSGVPKGLNVGDRFAVDSGRVKATFRLRNDEGNIRSEGRYEVSEEREECYP